MAREHARIWLDINDDDDFEQLGPIAQWLYVRVLLTDATLNYCGVADWRPKRLLRKAAGLTLGDVLGAAAELEQKRYALFDLDSEEVLVRSYIRRDELLRNPKMAATVIKAYPAIASSTLRAAVVTEVLRIKAEHPEYSSWAHKDTGAGLSRLLGKTSLEEVGYTLQITIPDAVQNGIPHPVENTYRAAVQNGNPDVVQNGIPDHTPDHQSQSARNPSTSTSTLHPAPLGGYVSTEGHQGGEPDPNLPPPEHCPKHPEGTDAPCRACGGARQRREAWEADNAGAAEAVRAAAKAKARKVREECPDCDEAGWLLAADTGMPVDPAVKCSHLRETADV